MIRTPQLLVLLFTIIGVTGIGGQEPTSSSPDLTGHDLLAACTQQIRRITGGPVTGYQTYQAGSCVGFLIAIHVRESDSSEYCPPNRWKRMPSPVAHNDLTRAVVLYLMQHRKDLDCRGDTLVSRAFKDAFPCQ